MTSRGKKISIGLGLLLFLLLVAGGVLAWELFPTSLDQAAKVHIPPGQSLTLTAGQLKDAGVVRNATAFRWIYQLTLGAGSFPSGTFLIPAHLSALDLSKYFATAQPLQTKVTIPEGWTAKKIAQLLEQQSVVKAADFLKVVNHPALIGDLGTGLTTLEGRLFPDTYLFAVDSDAVDVAKDLVETFSKKTVQWTGGMTPQMISDRLILASIVEREYRVASEAPIIASVFDNRLKARIALGSCATIEYILTELLGKPHPHRILLTDTQIESPYNTYLHRGLPPGPISDPGLTALAAAFLPAKTDYLYFVIDDPDKGTHRFSANFAEHEKARATYLSSFVSKG